MCPLQRKLLPKGTPASKACNQGSRQGNCCCKGLQHVYMDHEQGDLQLGRPRVSQIGGMQFKQPRAFQLSICGTKASSPGTIPSLTGRLKAINKPLLEVTLAPGDRQMAFASMLPASPYTESGKASKTW